MNWTEKAAQQIEQELTDTDFELLPPGRLAVIIATHAEPLVALLARREHYHDIGNVYNCCACCGCANFPTMFVKCTCGADTWNARVDLILGSY